MAITQAGQGGTEGGREAGGRVGVPVVRERILPSLPPDGLPSPHPPPPPCCTPRSDPAVTTARTHGDKYETNFYVRDWILESEQPLARGRDRQEGRGKHANGRKWDGKGKRAGARRWQRQTERKGEGEGDEEIKETRAGEISRGITRGGGRPRTEGEPKREAYLS